MFNKEEYKKRKKVSKVIDIICNFEDDQLEFFVSLINRITIFKIEKK